MTTITRFTKEQLIKRLEEQQSGARYALSFVQDSEILRDIEMDLRITEIALASLEAEPVMYAMTNGSFDEEAVSTGKAVVDAWVDEWNQEGAGEPLYKAVPLYTAPPAPVFPETLPCAVELKPGLIIGKGCKTETLLTALQRRADYYAEIDAMTPEERAEHDANIAAFKAMLPQPAPDNKQMDELVMWVKRLAHSLRKTHPDSKLQSDAMDYLSRKGLIRVEDVLR
ncbi:hypothetical protein [Citrobacter koseri]|uniref:hypothetical protein n=1 Tax=Citrobacter koseri TaxID=545 RepID=UPI001F17600F|nr:hypothetical protein [Citrobacter koseri]